MAGIPISELLERADHINYIFVDCAVDPEMGTEPMPGDAIDEVEYIRNIERDFAGKADGILESLNLSHLKASAHKSPGHFYPGS
jgi:hypothetical protein